jgi:hypothetical protein
MLNACNSSEKSVVNKPGAVDSLVQKGVWGHLNVTYPAYNNLYADSVISVFAKGLVKEFRSFTGDERISENWSNEMQVSYEEYFTEQGIVSVIFNIYQFTGGAHGNTFLKSINLNSENNKTLYLKDFVPQADFKNLQSIIRKKLADELDFDEFIDEGTAKWSDFSSFAVTDTDIIFWFSPYQVAPYSYGVQKVIIPKKVISSQL